jgi:hypothetical protein
MKSRASQAVPARRSRARPSLLNLRHAVVLALLALLTTAPSVRASRDAAAGWSAELTVATPLGPQTRPVGEYPGQLRLPARDDRLVRGLAVQSATFGQRPSPSGGTPFYQVILGDSPDGGQPMLARFFGAPGPELFPSFGGGPDRPEGCADSAVYCTESLYGPDGPITTETFYGLTSARGDRARVVHSVIRGGQSWSVVLYSPDANAMYGFTLHGRIAEQVGANDLGPGNATLARKLVDLAAGFELVSLRDQGAVARSAPAP